MNVLKFGGTSVGSPERIKEVANLALNYVPGIIVLSAMGGVTDKLVEIGQKLYIGDKEGAKEIIDSLQQKYVTVVEQLYNSAEGKQKGKSLIEKHFTQLRKLLNSPFSEKEEKEILAEGELISTHFFLYYLEEIGVPAAIIPALDFMRINEDKEPDFNFIRENVKKQIEKNSDKKVLITQGYICRNVNGEIDNLQRGGSDYTATLIGAAIHANEVQIWTDIDGVHNNDPRIVDNTKPVTNLSFDEAAELAYFGAKILHPLCVIPCIQENIPVHLKNTMDPDAFGTLISGESIGDGIKSIAAKDGITAIKVKSSRMLLAYGFLRKVFEIFEKYKTPIDMITTSEVSVSVTIDNEKYLNEITYELNQFGSVELDKGQSIICVVGNLIAENKGLAAKVFNALKDIPIRMISYGGSRHNISVLIPTNDKKQALNKLSKHVF